MDHTREPTQDGQTDVDQEVSTTSALQEHAQRRQDDGEDDLADVPGRVSWHSQRDQIDRETENKNDELKNLGGTYEAVKGMVTVERKRMGRERNAEMYFKRELRPHYIMMRHCGYADPARFGYFQSVVCSQSVPVFCCLVDLLLIPTAYTPYLACRS